ncbi:MAG: ABC transporter substrate-binding protein [bacterium]
MTKAIGKNAVMHPLAILSRVLITVLVFSVTSLCAQQKAADAAKKFAPGVTESTIRFATIIAGDVSPADRKAMLAPMEFYIKLNNDQVDSFKDPRYKHRATRRMAESMLRFSNELANRRLMLSKWVLSGPSSTWGAQLKTHYRKDPVFALIGGIANGEWRPIHEFAEKNNIPTLFPITDLPVISDTDWHTIYFSRGYDQEGENSARFLKNVMKTSGHEMTVVQFVGASPEGRALALGFSRTWKELGMRPEVTVRLATGETLGTEQLAQVLEKKNPTVILVWDGPKALATLNALSDASLKPNMLFISGRYMGDSIWRIKDRIRDFTFITYPFSFSAYRPVAMGGTSTPRPDPESLSRSELPLVGHTQQISAEVGVVLETLTAALMDMRSYYKADNFLDAVDMMPSRQIPLYGTITLGSGHRYVSKGCYIVKLSNGAKPRLIRKSDWVITDSQGGRTKKEKKI